MITDRTRDEKIVEVENVKSPVLVTELSIIRGVISPQFRYKNWL